MALGSSSKKMYQFELLSWARGAPGANMQGKPFAVALSGGSPPITRVHITSFLSLDTLTGWSWFLPCRTLKRVKSLFDLSLVPATPRRQCDTVLKAVFAKRALSKTPVRMTLHECRQMSKQESMVYTMAANLT